MKHTENTRVLDNILRVQVSSSALGRNPCECMGFLFYPVFMRVFGILTYYNKFYNMRIKILILERYATRHATRNLIR